MQTLLFQALTATQRENLQAFYRQEKQKIQAKDLSQYFFLQHHQEIVAALKAEPIKQPDSWFIRNVWVTEEARGQGLAQQILQKTLTQLHDKPCYCLAYQHLQALYLNAGFTIVDQVSAADIFQKRFRRYQKKAEQDAKKAVILMVADTTVAG